MCRALSSRQREVSDLQVQPLPCCDVQCSQSKNIRQKPHASCSIDEALIEAVPTCFMLWQCSSDLYHLFTCLQERVRFVEWDEPRQAVPAFLTILTMPLTYSIAYGLVIGLLSTGLIWFCDILWESTRVLCGQGEGKTMRHVMLDAWSNWIVAFGYESVRPCWSCLPAF